MQVNRSVFQGILTLMQGVQVGIRKTALGLKI